MKNKNSNQFVDRIGNRIKIDNTDPFVVMYGNVNDLFIGSGLHLDNIDKQINHKLKHDGYERVLFFDPMNGLYDVDKISCDMSMSSEKTVESFFTEGPLGNDVNKETPQEEHIFENQERISDLSSLEIMDHVFHDTGILSAIVFAQADILGEFKGLSQLRSTLRHWSTEYQFLYSDTFRGKRNIVVFVFQCSSVESVKDIINDCELVTLENFLLNRDDEQHNFSHIGGPDSKEVKNLINYIGNKHSITIDRINQSKISEWLSMNMLSLRQLYMKIYRLSEINMSEINRILQENNSEQFCELSAEERLDSMIGLTNFKKQILDTITVAKRYGVEGAGTLNMAFLGNPGTFKTSGARLVGEMYRNAGVLKRGHTVFADRAALVAKYVGHTAPRVNTMVDRALDGVLFIDEAYSLETDEFGNEAIATLIIRMENERNRLCVILAGYPEETNRLIDVNPGLRSRFQNQILFEDYSADELLEIFKKIVSDMCDRNSSMPELHEDTSDCIKKLFSEMTAEKDRVLLDPAHPEYSRFKNWSNGREARNLYEKMLRCCAIRVSNANSTKGQDTLLPEDIPPEYRKYLLKDD